ncbi:MAG: hypothetical protein SGBAC_012930 [Bacillariaceae sp.]
MLYCGVAPAFWTGAIAILAYWHDEALNGKWVYDDAGSVIKNVVVNGQVPWKEAFTRDYWGSPMAEEQSHKSFRPITTLTLKANYVHGMKYAKKDDKYPPTYWFHVVNVLLHGLTTALITRATSFVFMNDVVSQLIVGFLFGLHPVHAEVVSNITSRGEMLMSIFHLIAFLSFASCIQKREGEEQTFGISSFLGIYIVPWLFMTLSLFSKEQGATTLITLVLYDFLQHHGNVLALLDKLKAKDKDAWTFTFRTIVLAIQTVLVVLWRYILNGETSPDFIVEQNPAGFAEDRFTRYFSVTWVYCLYIRDSILPLYLSPDWSGLSIDLIEKVTDPRALVVMSLWYCSGVSFWSMVVGDDSDNKKGEPTQKLWDGETTKITNMAVWAFTFSPFLLSSNILIVVGLMKADRVIYLPLFGFCILETLLLKKLLMKDAQTMPMVMETKEHWKFGAAYFFLLFQLAFFCGRTHERNLAWSDSLKLWSAAYAVNPRSHHTMYNFGYELSIKRRYSESEYVMRPIGNPRVQGPSNTFVYAMVLFNLGKCDDADRLLDIAFDVIDEKRAEGGVRDTESSLARTESNLLVARAHCEKDFYETGKILYDAVQTDPSNEYAIGLATEQMQKIERYEKLRAQEA